MEDAAPRNPTPTTTIKPINNMTAGSPKRPFEWVILMVNAANMRKAIPVINDATPVIIISRLLAGVSGSFGSRFISMFAALTLN
jgi:hypothetical protein